LKADRLMVKPDKTWLILYKIIVASSQWSASKIAVQKRYGKAAELTIKGDKEQPLSISWEKD
jgi:hypothetical protein